MRKGSLEELIDAVERHYASSSEPLLLSRLGQLLQDMNFRGFGGLAAAIREAGEASLTILNPADVPGAEIVSLPGQSADLVARRREQDLARSRDAAGFDALPVPVRLAFCVGASGDRIALNLTPPFRYVRLAEAEPPSEGQIPVDERFRRPGLYLRTASEDDRQALWHSFRAWAREHGLRLEAFGIEPAAEDGKEGALGRFLAAQDADVRDRVRLPNDIAEILRAHR